MYALLLLPILVSGYIICRSHPSHAWKFQRYEGQRLYLHACLYGLISLAISFGFFMTSVGPWVLNFVSQHFSESLNVIYRSLGRNIGEDKRLVSFSNLTLVSSLSIMTVMVALLWSGFWNAKGIKESYPQAWHLSWWIGNSSRVNKVRRRHGLFRAFNFTIGRFKKIAGKVKQERKLESLRKSVEDSPLELFLYQSFLTGSLVQVSVKNDKVYVGIVVAMGDPDGGETFKEIALLPMMSGYRDKEERKIYLSNDYPQLFFKSVNGLMDAVYIPRGEIYSYGGFDLDVYTHVNGSGEGS